MTYYDLMQDETIYDVEPLSFLMYIYLLGSTVYLYAMSSNKDRVLYDIYVHHREHQPLEASEAIYCLFLIILLNYCTSLQTNERTRTNPAQSETQTQSKQKNKSSNSNSTTNKSFSCVIKMLKSKEPLRK